MISHTLLADEPILAPQQSWCLTAKPENRKGKAADDSNRECIDWLNAAPQVKATFVYFSGESNTYAEIENDWASLAKAARNRWLRDNPF